MAINALIAGGIAPVQTTSIADREAKRAMTDGQLRMNALNDDKLRENAYAIQQRNALNEAYAAENAQPGSGAAVLAARGQASAIPEMNKTRTAQETAELTNKTASTKLYVDRMKAANDELRFVTDVTGLEAWAAKMQSDPVIAQNSNPQATAAFMREIQAAKQNPALFQKLFQQVALGADEFTKRTTQTLDQVEADKFQREQLASGDARAKEQLGLGYAQLAAQKEENERRARGESKPPSGYRYLPDGSMEAVPGGPADTKAQIKSAERIKGASDVEGIVAGLRDAYDRLQEGNGITNTDQSALSNVGAAISSSALGQTVGKALGTKNQSARNDISMGRPALLAAIMKATGMSSKQLDSNAELKLWLATATDPNLDVGANRRALDNIVERYVTPNASTSTPAAPAAPAAPASGSDEDLLRKYGGL